MTPPPLWELVEQFRDPKNDKPYRGPAWCADKLAAALLAWDEHFQGNDPDIRESFVREQLLGVPPKEPAQ